MKNYYKYISKYKWVYFAIIALSGVAAVCNLVKTYSLSFVVDEVIQHTNLDLLKNILILFSLMLIIELCISYVVGYLNTKVSQEISFDLRKRLMNKIERISLKKISGRTSSEFVVNATDDVNYVSNMLCNYIVTLVSSVFTLLITMALILYLSAWLSFISLLVILLQVVISIFVSKLTKKNQIQILENNGVHLGFVRQIVSQIKYIRAYRAEQTMADRYQESSQNIVRLNFKAYLISYVCGSLNMLMNFVGSLVILVVGIVATYHGEITVGTLFVFDSLTGIVSSAISSIVNLIIAWAKASVSLYRLNDVLSEEEENREGLCFDQKITHISFNDVGFSYDGNVVLEGVNINLEEGNIYGIVGRSGIGKSTLVGSILKFFVPDSGKILINDLDLHSVSTTDIRSKVSMVFQEGVILDNCSIRDNITFGGAVDNTFFEEVIRACHIYDFTHKLEHGLDTIVSENGTNLSGGEKQRIYIARALLRDGDVFIFDEAFSGIDAAISKDIFMYLKQVLANKIVIVISHDIAMVRDYDSIIVIDDDRKITIGSHKELLTFSKKYRELIG